METIIILGAGGFARELYGYKSHGYFWDEEQGDKEIFMFEESERSIEPLTGVAILNTLGPFAGDQFILGTGQPALNKRFYEMATTLGLRPLHNGIVLTRNVVVTSNAKLGKGVVLNVGCCISHDCVVGDFAVISPHVVLGGGTVIGECAFLGIGVVTVPGVKIGAGAIVGAGSVVTKDIPDGETWCGVPARKMTK